MGIATRIPSPPIRDLMTRCPITIGCDHSLAEARERMQSHGLRHLPIVENGKLVGVVSERDLYRLREKKRVDEEVLTVKEAMSPEPYVADVADPIDLVAREMARQNLGCAVVLEKGTVVGIFTTSDALRVIATTFGHETRR